MTGAKGHLRVEEGEPEAIDDLAWRGIVRPAFPEAQAGWLRFLNSPASGYSRRIRVVSGWRNGSLEAALLFTEAERTLMPAHGVEAGWQRLRRDDRRARGLRCWLPISIYHGIVSPSPAHPAVLRGLIRHLLTRAAEEGYHFVSIPGVPGTTPVLHQVLQEMPGCIAPGLTATQLTLAGGSLENHLRSLSWQRRRHLLRARREMLGAGGNVVRRRSLSESEALQCWELIQATAGRHGSVPPVQLPFFRHCGTAAGVDCEFLLLTHADAVYAFAFVLFAGRTFSVKFFGSRYDEHHGRLHPYWNALLIASEAGNERGCSHGFLGPTMYAEKRRLGCDLIPTVDYVFPVSAAFRAATADLVAEEHPDPRDRAGRQWDA